MAFSFRSIASGSSGNCYVVSSDETALLVDVGISGKRILEGLSIAEIPCEKVSSVLITHEHDDHVRSVRVIGKKLPHASFYASCGTFAAIDDSKVPAEKRIPFNAGDEFDICDIHVTTFSVSHDAADPVGYAFDCKGRRITIITDTGFVPEHLHAMALTADLLVMESNHEEGMLEMNERYPYQLKRRIKGDFGHLSNITAAEFLCCLIKKDARPRKILLAHLSKENNFPQAALQVATNALEESGCCRRDLSIDVLSRDEVSKLYIV